MSETPQCACAAFDRLEGASVPAYVAAFLDQDREDNSDAKNLYRCRVCGRRWEKRAPEVKAQGTRPSLIRLDETS